MSQKHLVAIAVGLVLLMLAGATMLRNQKSDDADVLVLDTAGLTEHDGRDGRRCLVAVDGVIYEIKDSPLWQGGEHTTSEGRASCGQDLSEIIKLSPHGKSKLETLEVVGELQP